MAAEIPINMVCIEIILHIPPPFHGGSLNAKKQMLVKNRLFI